MSDIWFAYIPGTYLFGVTSVLNDTGDRLIVVVRTRAFFKHAYADRPGGSER